jgi:type III pantothenate kinase
MLLTIDIGNTNIVLGGFRGEELAAHFRLTTQPERTADEYGVLTVALFREAGISPQDIEGIILCSVVPPLTPIIETMARERFGHVPLTIEPGVKTGMPILYENPHEVGADRIVNGVAAFQRYGGPAIVIDFGTATTFDTITAKGEYLGGVIAPGVKISAEALFSRAARLPRVDIKRPARVIGRNTVASMQSGIYFGYAGLVEGIVKRIVAELGEGTKVVATGGLAPAFEDVLPFVDAFDAHLTLHGLRLVYERNRPA